MPRYVAFLKGMNLGNRRITNDDLCGHFRTIGLADVSAFLASGNVLFSARKEAGLEDRIARGLETALNYPVDTFVRTDDAVRAIAANTTLADEAEALGGKVQVALMAAAPAGETAAAVEDLATPGDLVRIVGRELYFLPTEGIIASELDFKRLEELVGPVTVRTKRTYERLAARF